MESDNLICPSLTVCPEPSDLAAKSTFLPKFMTGAHICYLVQDSVRIC